MLLDYWPHFTFLAVVEVILTVAVIAWVLAIKRESTSAVAWCLVVMLVPFLGATLFWFFGYNRVSRPLEKRRLHRLRFRQGQAAKTKAETGEAVAASETWNRMGELAAKVNAFPVSPGNAVTVYHDTQEAFDALLEAVRAARHHVHLEYFIFRNDATGRQLIEELAAKAREGVQVRLLYDAVGGHTLRRRTVRPLLAAGGKVDTFLPMNLLRFSVRINLRNHRKITVVDGRVGFTGGMNIGDEYLGKGPYFGYWRDTFVRLEGPAVADLQRVFVEDWHFTSGELPAGPNFFPDVAAAGDQLVQVVASGPDQDVNSTRQVYFAAILSARERIWIASPYFVPDGGLLDALRLARYRGVEVRLLTLLKPDHFLSFYASRYYWADMLETGVKVYQYAKGMMHSKVLLVDGQWGMVGSANLDNRSMRLNFEINCVLHEPALVADLEQAFRRDVKESVLVDARSFAARSSFARVAENACRLFSPTL